MIHNAATGETVFEQENCRGVSLYEAHGTEYIYLLIDQGGSIPEHCLPLAVSFCVLEGTGICTVSGRSFSASAGDMIECPPGEPRGWKNASAEQLKVLVIKRTNRP